FTHTAHLYVTTTVGFAEVNLVPGFDVGPVHAPGHIHLTIPVWITFNWENWPSVVPTPSDFHFTISQGFTLNLAFGGYFSFMGIDYELPGRQIALDLLGDLVVDIPSDVPSDQADSARKQAKDLFRKAWNGQKQQVQTRIQDALGVDRLQKF